MIFSEKKSIHLLREFQGAFDDTGRYLVCGEDLTCCYESAFCDKDPFDQGLLCSKWIILNSDAFSTLWIPNSRELVIVFFCGKPIVLVTPMLGNIPQAESYCGTDR